MPDPVVITVALAGTPEAATADFVCDGVDDDIEINAAIAAAVDAGGGVVRLAAGDYSTSRAIAVLGDGIAFEGDPAGGTAIRPAADWASTVGPEGASLNGIVNFVGVDNFAARHLTVESTTLPGSMPDPPLSYFNGIQAIPTGVNGAGQICTNGVFEDNTVRMAQGHTYSIWSLRSEGMQIIDNFVDGGSTVDSAHTAQEGIEIYGGRDVLISGNTIIAIGNAAINMGGLAEITPDSSIEGITVVGNHISFSRIGVFIGTTWGTENGAANARDILVEDNVFDAMFETGFQIRNWTGSTDSPPEVSGVIFRHNEVQMLRAEASGFNPAGVWFFDATASGATLQTDIVVEDNVFTTLFVDRVPSPFYLGQGHAPFVGFLFFSGVTFQENDLDLTATSDTSKGIISYFSDTITVADNRIGGAGVYPIEFYGTSQFAIERNALSDWGRGTQYSGILVGAAGEYSITGNELTDASGAAGPNLINIYDSDVASSLADNLRIVDQDATLAGSVVQHLTLTGAAIAGTGNALENIVTGNDAVNLLNGGAGNDTYYVQNAGDSVVETAGGGTDRVVTTVSYVLGSAAAVETLEAMAGTAAINLTGNGFAQTLIGNDGANLLHGGGGTDVLKGLGGNDLYFTDVAATQAIEAAGGGSDQLYSSVSYVLAAGSEIELLSTNSTAATVALNLTGNSFGQILLGNNGANLLHGGGGIDTLIGYDGNDIYFTDVAATQVLEGAGGGNDQLYTSASYALAAGSEIELLSTNSTAASVAINLTGNELAQLLLGNAGANTLDGKSGADTLYGYGGADTFAFTTTPGTGNIDHIGDFSAVDDTIALAQSAFAGLGLGALNANAFVIGTAAGDADDRIIYDSATGALFFDADGNGAGAAVQFATLDTHPTLTASDFMVT